MYALQDYARMIAARTRTSAYVRALEATVRPGSVVVDIGTGTGLLALVACRLGARRVYALDTNPAIEVGRELARQNGFSDRISFLQQDALSVELPERGNVVVFDLRGSMPLAPGNLAIAARARDRFLAPGGALIPERDAMKVAVVGASSLYEQAIGQPTAYGVSLEAMRARLTNEVHRDPARSLGDADLVTPGATWALVEYGTTPREAFRGRVEWIIDRSCVGYGLVMWFDAALFGGDGFTTAPGSDVRGVYPQPFLPWSEPVALQSGDRVAVELWAQADGEPWGWNTSVTGSDGGPKAEFKQSSFLGRCGGLVRSDAVTCATRSEV